MTFTPESALKAACSPAYLRRAQKTVSTETMRYWLIAAHTFASLVELPRH